MRPEAAALLWDIDSATERVGAFISGLSLSEYIEDALVRSAVERQLEIAGEALKRLRDLDPEMAAGIPDSSRIIGMRNILAHGYAVVDDGVVWTAATRHAPRLRAEVARLLG
ncbi:DUF86 domain-containing protein [Microbacterium sp. G2-8]|uniref:HepT-like ribonuclease domain-containing protein n=1 Tax=Microbacterium sp. G2-8 TaxID=2842454 RepID=UPI001C8A53C0|nr:HepT-like ribonuclease domain-containing protein [Microbacterium sp. G2-8]